MGPTHPSRKSKTPVYGEDTPVYFSILTHRRENNTSCISAHFRRDRASCGRGFQAVGLHRLQPSQLLPGTRFPIPARPLPRNGFLERIAAATDRVPLVV